MFRETLRFGRKLREPAFRLDIPKEEVPAFLDGMNAIVRMPIETLLQMLCTLNHFLNDGETLRITALALLTDGAEELRQLPLHFGVQKKVFGDGGAFAAAR